MKKICILLVAGFLSMPVFAQSNVVDEAKAQIAEKHHKQLVEQAEAYLEEKEELEAKLAVVNEKIAKMERGEKVKEETGIASFTTTGSATACCYLTVPGR